MAKVSNGTKTKTVANKTVIKKASPIGKPGSEIVGKTIFIDSSKKSPTLVFGFYDKNGKVDFVDYKTWKKLPYKDVSKSSTNKNYMIKAILANQKQFNKKVDFNVWYKMNNPSFEEQMDYFISKGWLSNVTKSGIKFNY